MAVDDAPSQVESPTTDGQGAAAVAAALVGAGLILGVAGAWLTRRHSTTADHAGDRRDALVTYLREHLAGSDTAIQIVERLRRSHAGTAYGRLFGSLFAEFQRERDLVRAMLHELGASSFTVKRTATILSGRLLATAAAGQPGDLAFFRTLEGLALGVQGKRCLWRAAQELKPGLHAATHGRLKELEGMAQRQWEAIDRERRALVSQTFSTPADAASSGSTVPMDRDRHEGVSVRS